jgi:hypothetical protein
MNECNMKFDSGWAEIRQSRISFLDFGPKSFSPSRKFALEIRRSASAASPRENSVEFELIQKKLRIGNMAKRVPALVE